MTLGSRASNPSGSATFVANGGSVQTTPAAATLAAQLKTQLVGTARVTASGSYVIVEAPSGILESNFDRLSIVSSTNQPASSITQSSIGIALGNGTMKNLGYGIGTATALLSQNLAVKGGVAQTAALAAGRPNYTVTIGPLSIVDKVRSVFPDIESEGLPKVVYGFTLDTAAGAVVDTSASSGVGCGEDKDCM